MRVVTSPIPDLLTLTLAAVALGLYRRRRVLRLQ
jgi:MYXO-CTERM domain-containing protein